MSSDIKLLDNQVKVEAADFLLDATERRPGTDPAAFRRALVHDGGDALTINFDADYKGGVRIFGGNAGVLVECNAPISLRCTALSLGQPGSVPTGSAIEVSDKGPGHDTLGINEHLNFHDVEVRGRQIAVDSPKTLIGVELENGDFGGIIIYPDHTETCGNLKVSGDLNLGKDLKGQNAKLQNVAVENLTVGNDVAIISSPPSGGFGVHPIARPTRHQTITIGPMPTQRGVTGSTIIATTTMSGMATLPGKQNAPEVIDVVAEIRSLRQRVAELERKLAHQPAPL